MLILPDDVPAHPYAVAMEAAMLAPNAEVSMFPWKEPKERIPLRGAPDPSHSCARIVGVRRSHTARIGENLPSGIISYGGFQPGSAAMRFRHASIAG